MSRILELATQHGVTNGIEWAVVPAPSTPPFPDTFNGYARVPEGHPWHQHVGKRANIFGHDVAVGYQPVNEAVWHNRLDEGLIGGSGELTYSDGDGWIGFDVRHACDDYLGWTEGAVAEAARRWAHIIASTGEQVEA